MKRLATDDPAAGAVFGEASALSGFQRITHIAARLFQAEQAHIILNHQGALWQSGALDDAAAAEVLSKVMADRGSIWIDGASSHGGFWAVSALGLRFCAAAPIRLEGGRTVGALVVMDRQTKDFDSDLSHDLQLLADSAGSEYERNCASVTADRNEADLDTTRSILTTLIDALPASVMMTDRDMRLIRISPRWLDAMQYGNVNLIGRSVYDIEPDYFLPFKPSYDRCLTGEHIRSARVKSQRNGHVKWLQTELVPWRDGSGAVGGLIVVSNDITKTVEAIDRMERSERRLNIALDLADIHVYELDFKAETLATAGASDTFFEEPQTFEGLSANLYATVDPRDQPTVRAAWDAYTTSGVPYRPQHRIARTDGKEIWVQAAVEHFADSKGRPARLVGAVRNITETKSRERELHAAKDEAESANQAKSAFLATMSHEIRTPLNGVLGMAQAMAADDLPDIQRERLDVIRQSGESLLAILNDVLDLSKIEAGKLMLEDTDFDLRDVAQGAYAAFTAIANKKGLSFNLAINDSASGVWRGDSTRVRQILYNLVSNALKFTDTGEVKVEIDGVSGALRLQITDTGVGMSDEHLGRLFAKFEQADSSTTRRFGGTGLGLSICRQLTTLMGGEVSAMSVLGAGSTFTVLLPLQRVGDATEQSAADLAGPEENSMACKPLRVLAAEDNSVNQLVLKTLLHQIGIQPVIVENGLQALELWTDQEWDIILMDVQMPTMDGPTAARIIRQRETQQGRARTPIIALTANAMAHQVADYRAAGMDGFVAKPIEVGKLFSALQMALAEPEQASCQRAAS